MFSLCFFDFDFDKKMSRKQPIPFASFIGFSVLIVYAFGEQL